MTSDKFTEMLNKEIDNYLLNRHYVGRTYSYNEMKEIAVFTAGKTMELVKKGLLEKT